MEGNPLCTLASLVVLIILLICPVKSWCKSETYKSEREVSETEILKRRFHAIDSDSFVGLMGKRGIAPARSHVDRIITDLLRQRTSECCCNITKSNSYKGIRCSADYTSG